MAAQALGQKFHVAARKTGCFIDQVPGNSRKPTFSTESTYSCPSRRAEIGQKQSFERVYKMQEDSVGTDKPFRELVESHPNHAAFFLQPNINQRPHHLARLLSFPDEFAI